MDLNKLPFLCSLLMMPTVALGGIIEGYRIDALGGAQASNHKDSWSHTSTVRVRDRSVFSGGFYIGTHHREYSNNPGQVNYLPYSSEGSNMGFGVFDNSLGNIVSATLNFNYSTAIYNHVDSLEYHYSGTVGARSNFNFSSQVGIIDNDSGVYGLVAGRTGAAAEAYCSSWFNEGHIRKNIGDGDDNYCQDNANRYFSSQAVSISLSDNYFDAIMNESFSIMAQSHIRDWTLAFGSGDDLRYGSANVSTTITNAFLSIDYDDGISDIVGSVPEPSILSVFGVGLAGLGLVNRRKRTS